jgi:uncharacterized protein YjaZ
LCQVLIFFTKSAHFSTKNHKLSLKSNHGGIQNGVITTNEWLDKDFFDPVEICKKIVPEMRNESRHRNENPLHFYRYIQKFGMYKPTRQAYSTFQKLKQQNVWKVIEKIHKKYQKKWAGPDIPVYIFPLAERLGLFTKTASSKSGISFHDKLFLFLTPNLTENEIEALFVHEYHHVCRMNYLDKTIQDYTLLDSIILEGLAEVAVREHCGEDYLAKWCTLYSEQQITQYWNKYIKKNLSIRKNQELHDQLLFGERGIPKMLGYAAGYKLIEAYKKTRHITVQQSFSIEGTKFLDNPLLK